MLEKCCINEEQYDKCYGCAACEHICPSNAINMKYNDKGFFYPQINKDKCINCGNCQQICPINLKEEGKRGEIYQVLHKNKETYMKSQSGGAFTAISDYVLSIKGVIYGVVFDSNHNVIYARTENKSGRDKMRGSKYVQSIITKDIYRLIENDIKEKKFILFTGTPCLCKAIKNVFSKYDKLLVCDFLCHGVPSHFLWKDYIDYMKKKYNCSIQKCVFRNKICRGVGNHTESYYLEDGREIFQNDYTALYFSHFAHRESCFNCQYAKRSRYSDLTFGGFLEPTEFKKDKDCSMLIVNTEIGRRVFECIKECIWYQKSTISVYKNQPCLYHAIPKPVEYDLFWEKYQKGNIEKIIQQFATNEIKNKYHLQIKVQGEKK